MIKNKKKITDMSVYQLDDSKVDPEIFSILSASGEILIVSLA